MSEKKPVLIICHTTAGQMYIGVFLNRIWYAPALARTPEEGILLAQQTPFSLIIFDGDMPEDKLRSDISLLRTNHLLRDQPLLVFLSSSNSSLSESLLAQGCSAVLTKPLDLSLIYGLLARLSGQPRSTPRISVKIRVEIEEGTPEKVLTCINLSEGGLFLRTLEPLREGSFLHIKFRLPLDSETINLAAEVVRTLPLNTQLEVEPGMGLRFIDISRNTLQRIRNYVQWEMTGDLEWQPTI